MAEIKFGCRFKYIKFFCISYYSIKIIPVDSNITDMLQTIFWTNTHPNSLWLTFSNPSPGLWSRGFLYSHQSSQFSVPQIEYRKWTWLPFLLLPPSVYSIRGTENWAVLHYSSNWTSFAVSDSSILQTILKNHCLTWLRIYCLTAMLWNRFWVTWSERD